MQIISVFISIFILLNSCNTKNDPVYTKLQSNVYKINNQYFYSEKVHTYLIELDDKILLFDIPTYSKAIEEFILSFKKPVYALLSHGSCGISDGTTWQKEIGLKVYAHKADTNHPWLRMKPDIFFERIPKFDENIVIIHTPGHSSGSICLLEKNSKSLFSGDTFYGNKNGEIKDFTKENPSDYENPKNRIKSCKKILNYDFENIYPFHYNSIEGNAKIKLIEYLKDK